MLLGRKEEEELDSATLKAELMVVQVAPGVGDMPLVVGIRRGEEHLKLRLEGELEEVEKEERGQEGENERVEDQEWERENKKEEEGGHKEDVVVVADVEEETKVV